jgi:hypothetical protein
LTVFRRLLGKPLFSNRIVALLIDPFRELEIIELKREIEMLKGRPTGSPDVMLLQQRFDQAVQEIEELRRESTDFYQDKLSLETLLTATTSGEQYSQHPAGTRALTHHLGSLSAYQNLANSKRLLQEENDLLKRQQTQTQRDLADATSKSKLTPPRPDSLC